MPSVNIETPSLDVERYRADFPILGRNANSGEPLIYLDNAASTQRPNAVIDAIADCYRARDTDASIHRCPWGPP